MPKPKKETVGAWIIHHGRKIAQATTGSVEFPAIDEAAKAATLLMKLGETNQIIVPKAEVQAIATISNINPRHELNGLLDVLKRKKLIDIGDSEVSVLGITGRGTLAHAAELYDDADPKPFENAAIDLAELASHSPVRRKDVAEQLGDAHSLTKAEVADFFECANGVGFVDAEGTGDDQLLFNGNLFRRDAVAKTRRVLDSLNTTDRRLVTEVGEKLAAAGCLSVEEVEATLSTPLLDKLLAAGMYDLNRFSNPAGVQVFVTAPSAFHKFVDPMIDDCFDLAKALVAALTYGMTSRSSSTGRITYLSALLRKLISGYEVGPATAIGEDYRVLETNRVIKIRREGSSTRFWMRLLKSEVGELALQVLTSGDASAQSLVSIPSAPMTTYTGPEESRSRMRKKQSQLSRKVTFDVLAAVREGRPIRK